MRMRAPEKRDVGDIGDLHVVDIAASSFDGPLCIGAGDGAPDLALLRLELTHGNQPAIDKVEQRR